jgi:hypothetical protein
MVCPCCATDCETCPPYCSFNVESSLDDSVGTSNVSATPSDCVTCNESEADFQSYGSNSAQTTGSVSGSGMSGSGRADESTSGGGVQYSRFGSIVASVECNFATKKWVVTVLLSGQSFQATDPFVSGVGFTKVQQTDALYSVEQQLGCAESVDEIEVVADEDGVTINGTTYSWVVDSFTESCIELDGNQDYQPCADYLPLVIPEVTVSFSRRGGC